MVKEVKISGIIIDLLEKLTKLLKKYKIPYAVMGGIALQAWGRERATKDIDITISLSEIKETEFLQTLKRSGLKIIKPSKRIENFKLIEAHFTPPELGLPIEVDFFIAQTEYQMQVLKRAVSINVLGRQIKLVSPEDLIISKLLSNRPLDRSDVQNIVSEQRGLLDKEYLFSWARKLGVIRRLESIWK